MINFIVSLTMSTKTGFAQKLARWAGKVSFGTGEPETLSTADVVRDGGLSPVTLRHSLSIKTEGMIAPLYPIALWRHGMTRLVVALVCLFCVATPLLRRARASTAEPWQTYVDDTYQVTFRFPREWKRDPLYDDRPYFGVERPLPTAGRGFFQLLLMGEESDEPKQICKGLAEHVVRPFGENPTTRPMKVDGQSACLVWPSKDQGAPWDAAVVIKYPQPVEINGERYSILELDADKNYILAIIRIIRFISSARHNSPFLLEISPQNAKKNRNCNLEGRRSGVRNSDDEEHFSASTPRRVDQSRHRLPDYVDAQH